MALFGEKSRHGYCFSCVAVFGPLRSHLDQFNGSFTIDMPRGSVQVLHNHGHAGKGVIHSIRPSDMMGKSGVLLLGENKLELLLLHLVIY